MCFDNCTGHDEDRCLSVDHPVWADGSQDDFRCELPDGHGGEHIGDEGSWSW